MSEQEKNKKEKSHKKGLIFGIITAIVAIIIIVLIILLCRGCAPKDNPSSSSSSTSTGSSSTTTSETTSTGPTPEPLKFTVRFLNNDGSIIKVYNDVIEHSSVVYSGPAPTFVGTLSQQEFYTFDTFDKSANDVTSDLDINALYKRIDNKEYHRYINYDGVFLYDTTTTSGVEPSYEGEKPLRSNSGGQQFNFISWGVSDNHDGTFTHVAQFENCLEGLIIVDGEITGYDGTSTHVTMPETWDGRPITIVEPESFKNNKTIQTVVISENVEYIGESAFQGCKNLTNVVLPTTKPLEIGESAFNNCYNLKNIILGENVTSIGSYSFCNSGLQSLTIPSSITTIEEGTFEGCDDLRNVYIPDTVKAIKNRAFHDCSSLESFDFTNIISVGNNAFFNAGLDEVYLPDTVEYMGVEVFNGYAGHSVYVEAESLDTLPNWSKNFAGGANVFFGYIGKGHGIGNNGFEYDFVKEERDGSITAAITEIYGFESSYTTLDFPDYVEEDGTNYTVTEIYTSTVIGNVSNYVLKPEFANIMNIAPIPDTVERIGRMALAAINTDKLPLPSSLVQLNYGALFNLNYSTSKQIVINIPNNSGFRIESNSLLTKGTLFVYLPSTIDFLSNNALPSKAAVYVGSSDSGNGWESGWNTGLEECIIFNSSAFSYESSKNFYYCNINGQPNLVLYDGPNKEITSFSATSFGTGVKVKSIGPYAFEPFSKIKSMSISTSFFSINRIYNNAFYGLELTSLSLHDSLEYFGLGNYSGLSSISYESILYYGTSSNPYAIAHGFEDVTPPSTVSFHPDCKIIGSQIFAGKINVQNVTLPSGLLFIGIDAFNSTSISSISIPTSVKYILSNAFCNTQNLVSFVFPDNVSYVSSHVLMDSGVQTVSIGDNVSLIGTEAFRRCQNLSEVHLGSSVKTIGYHAFMDCESLTTINMPSSCTRISDNAFSNCSNLKTLDISNVELVGHASLSMCGLEYLTLPGSIKTVSQGFVQYSLELETVIVSEGVEGILYNAFANCENLSSVTLPSTLKSIGSQAFEFTALTSITIPSNVLFIESNCFDGCDSLLTINVELDEMPNTWAHNWLGNCKAQVNWIG